MSNYGDEDVCRVCRTGPESGPLHKPCKCSGSIRYVHQDCLLEWLGHSRKQYCELCHYPFVFTKIYQPNVPESLPTLLILRKAILSTFWTAVFVIRAIFVAFTWIGVLPYATVWVWRFYWFVGNSLASAISDLLLTRWTLSSTSSEPSSVPSISLNISDLAATAITTAASSSSPSPVESPVRTNLTEYELYRDSLRTIGKDTFTGQIITCCVMIAFVCAFLLREWAHQIAPIDLDIPAPPPQQPQQNDDNNNDDAGNDNNDQNNNANVNHVFRWLQGDNNNNNQANQGDNNIDNEEIMRRIVEDDQIRELIGRVNELRQQEDELRAAGALQQEQQQQQEQQPRRFDQEEPTFPAPVPEPEPEHVTSDNVQESSSIAPDQPSTSSKPLDEGTTTTTHDTNNSNKNEQSSSSSDKGKDVVHPTDNKDDNEEVGSNDEDEEALVSEFRRIRHRDSVGSLTDWPLLADELDSSAVNHTSLSDMDFSNLERDPHHVDDDDNFVFRRIPQGSDNDDDFIVDEDDDDDDDGSDNSDNEDEEGGDEDILEAVARAEDDGERMDDLDSILETIGMKGSLVNLFQTVALVILMVSLILSATILIPFITGRVVTSPGCTSLFLAPGIVTWRLSSKLFRAVSNLGSFDNLIQRPIVQNLLQHSAVLLSTKAPLIKKYYEISVDHVSFAVKTGLTLLLDLSREDNNINRTICIILGYLTIAGAAATYASSWGDRYSERVGQAVRNSVTQQLMIFKVAVFLFIELILFPLSCGILLDLCTLPVFPNASVATRIAYHYRAPFSAIFLTWLIGTAFMFIFASLVSMARSGLRPGVLWFIKDPQDPQYQPIAELHKTPAGAQTTKLLRSACMYFAIIGLCFAVPSHVGKALLPSLFPLRWDFGKPLSPFPVDLLVYLFAVPSTIRFIRPRKLLRRGFSKFSRLTARRLRLSSFLFGQRRAKEEGHYISKAWWSNFPFSQLLPQSILELLDAKSRDKKVIWVPDGKFMRVPAMDSIKVVPGRAMFIQVNEAGRPTTTEGSRELMKQQVDSGYTEDNFTVVYLPPHYKLRLVGFLYLCWFSGLMATCTSLVAPLYVGRVVLDSYLQKPVHDVYSFGTGFYVLLALGFICERLYRGYQFFTSSSSSERPTTFEGIFFMLVGKCENILWWLRAFVCVGILFPLSVSAALNAYVFLPSKLDAYELGPIWVLQEWAYGLVYISITAKLLRTNLARGLSLYEPVEQIAQEYRQGNYFVVAQKSTLLAEKLTFSLVFLVIGPLAVGYTLHICTTTIISTIKSEPQISNFLHTYTLLSTEALNENIVLHPLTISKYIYGLSTCFLLYTFTGKYINERIANWLNKIRDDEFLVERRLRDIDDPNAVPQVEEPQAGFQE